MSHLKHKQHLTAETDSTGFGVAGSSELDQQPQQTAASLEAPAAHPLGVGEGLKSGSRAGRLRARRLPLPPPPSPPPPPPLPSPQPPPLRRLPAHAGAGDSGAACVRSTTSCSASASSPAAPPAAAAWLPAAPRCRPARRARPGGPASQAAGAEAGAAAALPRRARRRRRRPRPPSAAAPAGRRAALRPGHAAPGARPATRVSPPRGRGGLTLQAPLSKRASRRRAGVAACSGAEGSWLGATALTPAKRKGGTRGGAPGWRAARVRRRACGTAGSARRPTAPGSGGCCGCTPSRLRAAPRRASGGAPRAATRRACLRRPWGQIGAGAHSCGRTPAAAASPGRSSGRWSTAPGCPARTAACARGSPAGSRAPPAVTSRTHAHHHHRAAPDAIAARRVVPAKALPAIESCPRPSLFEQVLHCRTHQSHLPGPGFKACHQGKTRGQI